MNLSARAVPANPLTETGPDVLAPRIAAGRLRAPRRCSAHLPADDDLGLRVPAGFEVSLYADDTLAHDIFSMTIDSHGHVVVAGAGYVKILLDDDGDGRADRATLFSSLPASGAHGMVFDGDDLVCTGDNAVMRLRDTDGDGAADGKPEIWTPCAIPNMAPTDSCADRTAATTSCAATTPE